MAEPKATRLEFETDDEKLSEFWLADRMHCTVGELRRRMSQKEYTEWMIYHQRRQALEELQARQR